MKPAFRARRISGRGETPWKIPEERGESGHPKEETDGRSREEGDFGKEEDLDVHSHRVSG